MTIKYNKFQTKDLHFYAGDKKIIYLTVTDPRNSDAAVDLTGYTIVLTGKYNVGDASSVFTASATDGQNGSDFSTGIVNIPVAGTVTATLPAVLYYDIQATLSDDINTLLTGRIYTKRQIS